MVFWQTNTLEPRRREGRQEKIEGFKFMFHDFLCVLRALAVDGFDFLDYLKI
jgi:hypothetical protein